MRADTIQYATIVGAGLMGADIAVVLTLSGIAVTLVDLSDDHLQRALERMRVSMESLRKANLATEAEVGQALQKVNGTTDRAAAVANTEFVVESVPEDLALKREIFAGLDAEAPPEAILTSNTSSLSITNMAAATRRPERVVGSHFILPGTVLPLVEVVRGDQTSDETMQITFDLWQRAGKQPVMVQKDIPGFIHNRLQHALEQGSHFPLGERRGFRGGDRCGGRERVRFAARSGRAAGAARPGRDGDERCHRGCAVSFTQYAYRRAAGDERPRGARSVGIGSGPRFLRLERYRSTGNAARRGAYTAIRHPASPTHAERYEQLARWRHSPPLPIRNTPTGQVLVVKPCTRHRGQASVKRQCARKS